KQFKLCKRVPYESERGFCASIHEYESEYILSVKGAPERFSSYNHQIDIKESIQKLASKGHRVLAIGIKKSNSFETLSTEDPLDVPISGLVGLIDPPRQGAKQAIKDSRAAGIEVAMITGDHPTTSLAIAKALGLASNFSQVLTGPELKAATNNNAIDQLVKTHRVFSRVEPEQKLVIAQSLIRQGHFLAITGDGANDAPALKAAHVGVAMGKSGTDVAKESSELIITDDRFSSIIAGIEEGRVAYSNIRKVVYLLIATGASEILLFILCVFAGLPIPLTAVQILWLNLVTNGIQDVALAFEPKEGDELTRAPRNPNEKIFNPLMIQRVLLSAVVVALAAFILFNNLIKSGMELSMAQNHVLLLMVLFENIMVGNARSETYSGLKNVFRNPLLVYGTLSAQGIHIFAMHYTPLANVLGVSPVSFNDWSLYLLIALSVFITIEIHKWICRLKSRKQLN
ncbi:MAG: HAD-IC family P-type ATPase, partial [Bacteriovoracaceae bacterium]|nr:HAD-IC family P-type ATPase [Bacteriovoracaceae bacterium]